MFLVEYKGMNWVKIPIGAHTFEENAKATKSQKIVKKAALEKKSAVGTNILKKSWANIMVYNLRPSYFNRKEPHKLNLSSYGKQKFFISTRVEKSFKIKWNQLKKFFRGKKSQQQSA